MHPLMRSSHLAVLLLPLASTAALSALNPPPSLVEPILANVTSVALEWSESPASQGKTTYTVVYCEDINFIAINDVCSSPVTGKSTKKLNTTQGNLTASTAYRFQIHAEDVGGNAADSAWSDEVTTLDDGDPPGNECNYPGFSDPPGSSGLTDFVAPPWLSAAMSNGNPVFYDEFDGSASESWIIDDMTDWLNIAGNPDITESGANVPGARPSGKRWSAWYDDETKWSNTIGGFSSVLPFPSATGIHTVTGVGASGHMELGGVWENGVDDETRPGSPPWDNMKLHTAFLKTWAREQLAPPTGEYTEASGGQKWTAPMYLETMVDFVNMNTPGFRLSMWLMPATYLNGTLATNDEAYDGDPNNGMELDIFEYEPWKPDCGDLLEFSWINSFATQGKDRKNARGDNNFEGFEEGYDIDEGGPRKIALLWEVDRIQWIFEDKVVLEITGADKVPDNYQYLIVSREMTNGFLNDDIVPNGSGFYTKYLPSEPGLYGWAGGSNVGSYLGTNIDNDKTKIDYIKIYEPLP